VRLGAWEGVLRHAILEAKYARWRRLAFDLGCTLGFVLARRLQEAGVEPDAAGIVPVPMSFRRRWSRGLDHTLAIARGVRSVTGSSVVQPLRRRHCPPQASLAESAREANVRGCFLPRSGESVAHFPVVVLLDDVRTTGATLRAACRVLAARQRRRGEPLEPGQVWVATLAVVTPSDRRIEPGGPETAAAAFGQDSREEDGGLNF
jgi:predicted amidophosphoribosyltransferase